MDVYITSVNFEQKDFHCTARSNFLRVAAGNILLEGIMSLDVSVLNNICN